MVSWTSLAGATASLALQALAGLPHLPPSASSAFAWLNFLSFFCHLLLLLPSSGLSGLLLALAVALAAALPLAPMLEPGRHHPNEYPNLSCHAQNQPGNRYRHWGREDSIRHGCRMEPEGCCEVKVAVKSTGVLEQPQAFYMDLQMDDVQTEKDQT